MTDHPPTVNGYGAAVLRPPVPQRPPVSSKTQGTRGTFDLNDDSARKWSRQTRRFTLERTDFPAIPRRAWRHIEALQRLMTAAPFGLDEDTTNRHLRLLAELLDDTLVTKGPTP